MFRVLPGHYLHHEEEQQHERGGGDQPRGDDVLGLEALRVGLVLGALANAEHSPENRAEGILQVRALISKNVYESEIVCRSRGASALTRNTTGMSRASPGASVCSLKQKQACFSM